jgi:phosphoribosyl-AMP cyclohydrolase
MERIRFDAAGLIPVIAQQWDTRDVLMLAWMNEESLAATLETGWATYYSRSRNELWVKGQTSGNRQRVREVRVDCDGDALLLLVDQQGPACHSGLLSCFDTEVREVP